MLTACRNKWIGRWLAGLGLFAALPSAAAQIADQVIIYASIPSTPNEVVLRYDRKLNLLSETNVTPYGGSINTETDIAVNREGDYRIAFDALSTTQLLKLDCLGQVVGTTWLGHNPVNVAVDAADGVYALTRIPLLAPGPAYGLDATTGTLWSSMDGPALYTWYPTELAVLSTGALWMADESEEGQPKFQPRFARLDVQSGHVLSTFWIPGPGWPTIDTGVLKLKASADGTMWATLSGQGYELVKTDGSSVLAKFPIDGGFTGGAYHIAVDAQDRVYILGFGYDGKLLRYDPLAPESPETFTAKGIIIGFALGSTGEEAFIVYAPLSAPLTQRLERLNLRTGVGSSAPIDPVYDKGSIAYGDPTGFVFANVIDQNGDSDGDGRTNREETLAGSSPYDPLSRPEGPHVYVSFVSITNALVLTYTDPDGLLDAQGGLDLSTLSVTIGNFGNVFWFLVPFATALDLSADLTQATLTFGALPLPLNKKWQVEATVADLTGATGWDWQVTPPGDL